MTPELLLNIATMAVIAVATVVTIRSDLSHLKTWLADVAKKLDSLNDAQVSHRVEMARLEERVANLDRAFRESDAFPHRRKEPSNDESVKIHR